MIKHIKKIICCALVACAPMSFALQTKTVANNTSVTVKVSATQLTKIVVDDDWITDLYLSDGQIQSQIDNETGELFLLPQSKLSKHAFTLMVRTSQGHSYTLLAMPVDTPAETVLLLPAGSGNKKAARWENASNYQNLLVRLLKNMVEGSQPDGYKVIHLETKEKDYQKLGNIAYLKPLTLYKGKQLRGDVYEVINRTGETIHLSEREFYQVNDRAIALQDLSVAPHQSTLLYKEHDNA